MPWGFNSSSLIQLNLGHFLGIVLRHMFEVCSDPWRVSISFLFFWFFLVSFLAYSLPCSFGVTLLTCLVQKCALFQRAPIVLNCPHIWFQIQSVPMKRTLELSVIMYYFSLGKNLWAIFGALCGCSSLWSSPDMESLLLEWAGARAIRATVFWPAIPGAEPLPCEWELDEGAVPQLLGHIHQKFSFFDLEWEGKRSAGGFLSQWDMLTLDLELRGERNLSSCPHPSGGELPLNPAGRWGGRELVLAELPQILAVLIEF